MAMKLTTHQEMLDGKHDETNDDGLFQTSTRGLCPCRRDQSSFVQ